VLNCTQFGYSVLHQCFRGIICTINFLCTCITAVCMLVCRWRFVDLFDAALDLQNLLSWETMDWLLSLVNRLQLYRPYDRCESCQMRTKKVVHWPLNKHCYAICYEWAYITTCSFSHLSHLSVLISIHTIYSILFDKLMSLLVYYYANIVIFESIRQFYLILCRIRSRNHLGSAHIKFVVAWWSFGCSVL
jgi:hypothetical protein